MLRTYELRHSANAGKVQEVVGVFTSYRNLAARVAAEQWGLFQKQGTFDKNRDIKHVPSMLSARYKQTCQYQVVGIVESFTSNRQNDFVSVVRESSLDEAVKHKRFIVDRHRMWQQTTPFSQLKHKLEIDVATLKLAHRAVHIHKPAELIIERLDFRSPNLSRRMNRLISMFGKSVVNNKLDSLRLSLGIKITETNPAYSSQVCSVCGNVDKDNRVTQSQFKCKCCNTGIHADVNSPCQKF
jgi:hypothetical protein